jgi:small multidrug resistance pump
MPPAAIYACLALAIVAEVIATLALARVEGFARFWPTLTAVGGYAVAFFLLSFPLRVMPAGVVYAIWSGMGIVLVAALAWLRYGQRLDTPATLGIGLILAGVLVVNLFSETTPH